MGGNRNFGGPCCQRLLVPARAAGCIIGKKGAKINEMRNTSGAKIKMVGDNLPERMLIASGQPDQVADALRMTAQNIYDDFAVSRQKL